MKTRDLNKTSAEYREVESLLGQGAAISFRATVQGLAQEVEDLLELVSLALGLILEQLAFNKNIFRWNGAMRGLLAIESVLVAFGMLSGLPTALIQGDEGAAFIVMMCFQPLLNCRIAKKIGVPWSFDESQSKSVDSLIAVDEVFDLMVARFSSMVRRGKVTDVSPKALRGLIFGPILGCAVLDYFKAQKLKNEYMTECVNWGRDHLPPPTHVLNNKQKWTSGERLVRDFIEFFNVQGIGSWLNPNYPSDFLVFLGSFEADSEQGYRAEILLGVLNLFKIRDIRILLLRLEATERIDYKTIVEDPNVDISAVYARQIYCRVRQAIDGAVESHLNDFVNEELGD